jgi:hypothetical protein
MPARMLPIPPDLSPEEGEVWSRIAATKPGEWWDAGSAPLLAQYARATVQSEMVAELVRRVALTLVTDPDELGRYKELRKIQAQLSGEMSTLARSMRLTQQARYRADKADTTSRKASGSRPWQTHDIIDAN